MNVLKEKNEEIYFKYFIHEGCLEYDENYNAVYKDEIYTGLSYGTQSNIYYGVDTFINCLYSYVNGKRHGIWREWNDQGVLIKEELFNNGIICGYERKWGDKGNLIAERIVLDGIIIYKNNKIHARGEDGECFFEGNLESYINIYRREGRKGKVSRFGLAELKFQDTCYIREVLTIIDGYIVQESEDIGKLLREIICFTHVWLDKKDHLYKQFKRSIPIINSKDVNSAIVSDIKYNEDEDYYIFKSYCEYQDGEKNGVQLEWRCTDTKMHRLDTIREFKADGIVSEYQFKS